MKDSELLCTSLCSETPMISVYLLLDGLAGSIAYAIPPFRMVASLRRRRLKTDNFLMDLFDF